MLELLYHKIGLLMCNKNKTFVYKHIWAFNLQFHCYLTYFHFNFNNSMITHLFICKFKKNVSCEKRGEELGQAPVFPPMLPVHACFAPLFFHNFPPSCKNQCCGPGSWKLSAWWKNTEIGEGWLLNLTGEGGYNW